MLALLDQASSDRTLLPGHEPMYAFVILVLLSGSPQMFILERGLSEEACQAMIHDPDSGLLIDGHPVEGERSCVLESELPPIDDDDEPAPAAL